MSNIIPTPEMVEQAMQNFRQKSERYFERLAYLEMTFTEPVMFVKTDLSECEISRKWVNNAARQEYDYILTVIDGFKKEAVFI